jgi:hypothetical protein
MIGPTIFWLIGILGLIAAIGGGRVVAGGVHLPKIAGTAARAGVALISVVALLIGLLLYRGSQPPAGALVQTAPSTGQRANPGTGRPPGATATAAAPDAVRWHGTIGLNVNGSLLDEVPPKPAGVQSGDVAWYYVYQSIDTYTGNRDGLARWTTSGTPDRQACSDLVDTHPNGEVGGVHAGMLICARTKQQRLALLRVVAVHEDIVDLDVTVWELP